MIGIDTVRISRIQSALNNDSFRERVFTQIERDYCDGKANPAQSYAGIFCAKEATVKALKCGLFTGVMPSDLEIVHDEFGAPGLKAYGKAQELLSGFSVDVSISHDGDYAVAAVMLIKRSGVND